MEKFTKRLITIPFQSCNPFNQLHHSVYLDLFTQTVHDNFADSYALHSGSLLAETGKGWEMQTFQMHIFSAPSAHAKVWIEVKVVHVSKSDFRTELQMWDKEATKCYALAWIDWCYLDFFESKKIDLPAKYYTLFRDIVVGVSEVGFTERVNALLNFFKQKLEI